MTACVNRKHTKKVAAVVTASLVGALSLGVAPVAAMAEDTGIELQASNQADFSQGTVEWRSGKPGDKFEYTGYYTGLVPKTITTVSGQEYDLQLRGTHSTDEASDHAFYYYVKVGGNTPATLDGNTLQYKDADGNVKKLNGTDVTEGTGVNEEYARPTDPGTYAVVIYTWNDAGGYYTKVADTFTISALSLSDSVIYDGEDQTDTEFDYTGENGSEEVLSWKKRINVSVGGIQLVKGTDYKLQIWEKGGKKQLKDDTDLVPGTTYIVKVVGMNDYKGQKVEREFTFGKLDLSKATVVGNVLDSQMVAQPSKDSTIAEVLNSINDINLANIDILAQNELKVEFVKDPDGNQTSNKKQGVYTFKISAKSGAKYVEGSTTFTVLYAKNIVGINMSGCGQKSSDGTYTVVNLAKNTQYFDISKVEFTNEAGKKLDLDDDQYTVSVTKQDGTAATLDDLKTPGTYYVKVDVSYKGAAGNLNAGSAVEKVVVKYSGVTKRANIFFAFDGKNVPSDASAVYNGKNFIDEMAVKVVVENGTLVEGTDYTVTYYKVNDDDSRTAVDQIVDAGEYVVAVKGITFDTKKDVEFYFDVDKATPEIKVNWDLATENGGYFSYTGEAITPTFTLIGADGNPIELAEGDMTVSYDQLKAAPVWNSTYNRWDITVADDDVEVKDVAWYAAKIKLADTVANYAYDATARFHADELVFIEVSDKGIFLDVPMTGQWYSQVVYDAVNLGYMNGYNGTKMFGAGDSIKRGDVACVLFNMAGGDAFYGDQQFNYNENTGYDTGFGDVNGKAYYGKAIAWAHAAGIINGYGDGTFKPEQTITAEEFAAMLSNYAAKMGDDVEGTDLSVLDAYTDASQVSDWAKQAVAWAVENDVMGNGGFLAPTEDIARERVAAMAVNYQPEKLADMVIPVYNVQ
ncbi:S-layer homology domain-containing protein [Collinsella ihumii]|uniref:S-layer homology domain-containing protein n=1 Tax=Collinsella ihumii TaxID=1720204 RepID=A0ABT7XH23_9ACTN|nr:S-layer homology domain-containing protein [Collinsella ihumii]MDN0064718.1 S-layer homology domain-containing protein [Collinsella ihumii]